MAAIQNIRERKKFLNTKPTHLSHLLFSACLVNFLFVYCSSCVAYWLIVFLKQAEKLSFFVPSKFTSESPVLPGYKWMNEFMMEELSLLKVRHTVRGPFLCVVMNDDDYEPLICVFVCESGQCKEWIKGPNGCVGITLMINIIWMIMWLNIISNDGRVNQEGHVSFLIKIMADHLVWFDTLFYAFCFVTSFLAFVKRWWDVPNSKELNRFLCPWQA